MKTTWAKRLQRGLLLAGLVSAGVGLAGCADEYAAYPGYRGGYYASYSRPYYPYYGGYGYPYRVYGAPYYGYGYGHPYYGGSSFVVSGSNRYVYRDRYGRVHNRRNANRVRSTTRKTETRATRARQEQYQNDDERRYYTPR